MRVGDLLAASEGITQRELNQARSPDGLSNLAERAQVLYVGLSGAGKVGMVPDVEEVSREAQGLALGNREVLDQRVVPVLLERTAIQIAAEVAKGRGAEV